MAWSPPRRTVMTVSATQEASAAATTPAAAERPGARISTPASAVAGWPAATAGRSANAGAMRDCYPIRRPSPGCRACLPSRDVRGLGRRRQRRLMALTKEAKLEIIKKHGRGEADTGSPQVQIAMLTQRINELTEHLRTRWEEHPSEL